MRRDGRSRLSAILPCQPLSALKHQLLCPMLFSKFFKIGLRCSSRPAHRQPTSVRHAQAAHLDFGWDMKRIDLERRHIFPIEDNAVPNCLRVSLYPSGK